MYAPLPPEPGSPWPPPSPPPRRSLLVPVLLVGLLAGGTAGAALGVTLTAHHQSTPTGGSSLFANPGSQSSGSRNSSAAGANASLSFNAASIFQQAAPGVVMISTDLGSSFRNFSEGTGSGFVLDAQGNVLTNQHVVSGAHAIHVRFHDGNTVSGTVAGVDASDDLAVVKVSVPQSRLHPLTLGNSDAVQVGDPVLAIGAPFGLPESLSAGIVSGLSRSNTAPSGRALTGMQTDASINPGNSGGPLLNARGEVIGIDESIQSPVQGSVGVGFAVPSNTARTILSALEKGQTVQHPWLGISGETIDATLADSLKLSRHSGILVVQVISGSPAQHAGLKATGSAGSSDDIITAVDGHALSSIENLTTYLDSKHVGDHVTLSVARGSQTLSIAVTLGNFQQRTGG
jgi:S1-C subfamily serine protease